RAFWDSIDSSIRVIGNMGFSILRVKRATPGLLAPPGRSRVNGTVRPECLICSRAASGSLMYSLFLLIYRIIDIYVFILIASVIMSWLVSFNVINTRNRFVYLVVDVLNRLTEPVLRPIRRILPNMGGIDLSPLVLFLLLYFVQDLMREYRLVSPF